MRTLEGLCAFVEWALCQKASTSAPILTPGSSIPTSTSICCTYTHANVYPTTNPWSVLQRPALFHPRYGHRPGPGPGPGEGLCCTIRVSSMSRHSGASRSLFLFLFLFLYLVISRGFHYCFLSYSTLVRSTGWFGILNEKSLSFTFFPGKNVSLVQNSSIDFFKIGIPKFIWLVFLSLSFFHFWNCIEILKRQS